MADNLLKGAAWNAVQIAGTDNEELAWANGKRLGDLAEERKLEPYTVLVDLIRRDRGRSGMVGFGMSEENTERILTHPLGMVCSDGSALAIDGPLAAGPDPGPADVVAYVLGEAEPGAIVLLQFGTPDVAALPMILEGCIDVTPLKLLESWSRHTLVWINRWLDDGFQPLHAAWRERAWGMGEPLPEGGLFMGIDEQGGMLVKAAKTTELRPLTAVLEDLS